MANNACKRQVKHEVWYRGIDPHGRVRAEQHTSGTRVWGFFTVTIGGYGEPLCTGVGNGEGERGEVFSAELWCQILSSTNILLLVLPLFATCRGCGNLPTISWIGFHGQGRRLKGAGSFLGFDGQIWVHPPQEG